MPNANIKAILDQIAKSSSKVMDKADKINSQACPNCGAPVEQPMSDQSVNNNRADTDLPNPNGESSYDK